MEENSFFINSQIILFYLFATYLLNLNLLLLGQPLPHAVVHLDDTERLRMPHHLHILEALEGIGQDIPLDLLIGHVLPTIEAVGLFDNQTPAAAVGVVGTEELHEVGQLHSSLAVGAGQYSQHQHGLVRVTHVHAPYHVHEHGLAVAVVDQRPAVLRGGGLQRLLFEILEGAVLAHGYHQIRQDHALADVALDSLALHVYAPHELHLRQHPGGLLLPVEQVDQLVIRGVHGIIHQRARPLAPGVQALLRRLLRYRRGHQSAGVIVLQPEKPVQRIGHVVLAGVVHEVEHHQAVLAVRQAHAAPQLLGVKHLRHRGPRHEQHLGLRTVPALVQQVACAQHQQLLLRESLGGLVALGQLHAARHRQRRHTPIIQQRRNLLGVLDGRAEDDRPLVAHELQPGIHNQLVALRHEDLALQVPDVVLHAVEAHLGQVDVGVDTNAAHRHQLADFHGGLDVQAVRCIFEYFQYILIVGALRRGGQAKGKARGEVRQHLLIGLGGSVMGFVDNEIVEGVRQKAVQVQRHALHAGTDHLGVSLLVILHIQPQRRHRPELAESVGGLGNQVLGVSDVKRPPAHALRVADGGDGLAGAGSMVN